MIYRLRIILDVEQDVFRDLEIEATATLDDLHLSITQAFGFLGNEMASFYRTNDDWEQGEELPLLDLDNNASQANLTLERLFDADHHKLIYVYDFLNLWTFFVELMEMGEPAAGIIYPNLIFGQGEVPEEAPEKSFEDTSDVSLEEEDEESDDDFYDEIDENSYY